jgi:nitrogen fixation protein FixH
VVKLERDPKAKMTKQQQAVKEAWDKWRTDGGPLTKAVAEAKAAVAAASGPAEASLNQPGQPAFDASAFEGELLKKEVTVDAEVRSPTGDSSKKTLTISLERVAGTLAGKQREGRWIIAKITGI